MRRQSQARPPALEEGIDEPITPRQIRVAQMWHLGLNRAAIAQALEIKTRTVEDHVAAVYGKLRLRLRHEFVARVDEHLWDRHEASRLILPQKHRAHP